MSADGDAGGKQQGAAASAERDAADNIEPTIAIINRVPVEKLKW
jgi:hypothetical protein